MPNMKNLNGVVKIGAAVVAELLAFNWSEEDELYEDTELGDEWRTFQSGRKTFTGQIVTMYDDTDSSGQETLTVGASATLDFLPEGAATGADRVQVSVLVRSVAADVPEGNGMIRRTYDVQGTGAPTHDTVP